MEGLFLIFSEWAPVDIIKIGFSLDVGMKRSNRGEMLVLFNGCSV